MLRAGQAGLTDHATPARLAESAESAVYRIRVSGTVEADWARDLCGMEIATGGDRCTELVGAVADQSALLGVLRQLRDRNHDVLWLKRETDGVTETAGEHADGGGQR